MKIKSLAIIAVLVSAIFGFANIVKASCLDENFSQKTDAEKIQCLTSVISDLTAQIAQIQNQQQTPAPTPTAWCHTFNTYLYFGIQENMNGDVSALMAALIKDGEDPLLTCGGSGQYCTMNSQIVSALKQFQAKYGISQTGTTGPITRAKLNSLYGCPKPSCTDTDGGKDYFTKGTVTWTYNTGAGTTLTD